MQSGWGGGSQAAFPGLCLALRTEDTVSQGGGEAAGQGHTRALRRGDHKGTKSFRVEMSQALLPELLYSKRIIV